MQAPRPWTINDLWRMVWEYDCRGIVMLTSLVEAGKVRTELVTHSKNETDPVQFNSFYRATLC